MTEETQAAIQTLLDKDAIKELLYRHDYMCDDGDGVDAVARHCTDDVKFDAGALGKTEGKKGFQKATEEVFAEFPFTRHLLHNPIIDVNGDDAWSKWYALIPASTAKGEAIWWQVTYEVEFRRVDGKWKISAYRPDFAFVGPYEKGWARQRFIEGVSASEA